MSAPNKKKKTAFSDEVAMKEYEVSSDEDMSGSDDDDDQIDMHVDKGWDVKMDVSGFPLQDSDYHGVRQLLVQLFTDKSSVDISQLSDELIKQTNIGTVLKYADDDMVEDDHDPVFALLTCYSLCRVQTNTGLTSLKQHLVNVCNKSKASQQDKDKFKQVLENSHNKDGDLSKCSTCVGFYINERFVNLPFHELGKQMLPSLISELKEAQTSMRRVRNDLTHVIIIAKYSSAASTNQTSGSNGSGEESYYNFEDEDFVKKCELTFDYQVVNEEQNADKHRRVVLMTSQAFREVVDKLFA